MAFSGQVGYDRAAPVDYGAKNLRHPLVIVDATMGPKSRRTSKNNAFGGFLVMFMMC